MPGWHCHICLLPCLMRPALLPAVPLCCAGGRTALHWAAHHGMVKVLEELLSKGDASGVDAVDEAG